MRKRSRKGDVTVHAIAGTEVVLLGMNAVEKAAEGLLGFHIYKKQKGSDKEAALLGGERTFEGHEKPGRVIQGFLWGDYEVDPKTTYSYRVVPVYGTPDALVEGKAAEVSITTEDPEDKVHSAFFNRGAAGSQTYSERFGEHRRWYKVEKWGRITTSEFIKPEDVPDREAFRWLSRGLEEAMLGFIAQAKGPEYSIRAAVYEFTYLPAIQAFVDALERGVDVKIVHHAKRKTKRWLKGRSKSDVTMTYRDGAQDPVLYKGSRVFEEILKDPVGEAADEAVVRIGLTRLEALDAFDQMMIERTRTTISHNKFIVLLKNGEPIQVWTGSTNFTAGGVFGQSNVGHVVRDTKVAQAYYEYWQQLALDPAGRALREWNSLEHPDLKGTPPPNSMTLVFSPRKTKDMLSWYARRMARAQRTVFFTAAFSVADEIFEVVKKRKKTAAGEPYLRYLLLEGKGGLLKRKYPVMAKCMQNRIAWGATLKKRAGGEDKHKQFIETLTGLNSHVNYIHTKYMLIDPLSDDPVVITGSANFSKASTLSNDENMLIIRGNTRIADIFLGEFMRLFRHFRSRNRSNRLADDEVGQHWYLCPDDGWVKPYYTQGEQKCSERLLFG